VEFIVYWVEFVLLEYMQLKIHNTFVIQFGLVFSEEQDSDQTY